MDSTDINSQEHDGAYMNSPQSSNPAGDEKVDHPSADEVPNQTYVSQPQVTNYICEDINCADCAFKIPGTDTQEMSSEDDGSKIEKDVGKDGEGDLLEKDQKESLRNEEDKKGPKDVLKEIKMQKTHDLYCPNCTLSITETAELFEKGQETFPYNLEGFVFVIVFSFKYPFIYLSWNKEPVKPIQPKAPIHDAPAPGPKPDKTLPTLPEKKPAENKNNQQPGDQETQKEDSPNKKDDTSPIKLDILKSIIYGGLIESITSFGVVSSAAASGASTLNVLALGLANLFSGLFIIIHNLYGLFKGPRYPSWNNDHMPELKAADPYEELLGQRNRVILHFFVVLISFIFFGVIPPLFFGFSFILTDKGPYQQVAIVIAASLVCVMSLSFAKAYAFGMDKLKTVAIYTGIAICGSALSFVASLYARDVFAKYDFQKLASD